MLLLYLIVVTSFAHGVIHLECAKNYTCYAPEGCDDDRDLEKISERKDVGADCFAFLKFHAYSNKKTRIIMESFEDTEKIELWQKNTATNVEMVLLTCTKKDGITVAFQGQATAINNLISDNNRKLNCEFDVDLSLADTQGEPQLGASQDILEIQKAFVRTKTKSTRPIQISSTVHCIPSAILAPRDDFASNKYYEKARYELGYIVCDKGSIFNTIEFRSEETNTYNKVQDISCKDRKYEFHLNGSLQSIPSDEDLDVRCAADAEYFCNYNPKTSEIDNMHTVALERQKPDIEATSPIRGSIKCPDSHPLFVIGGRLEPIENAEIKCKNYYGKMKWTFKDYSTESSTETILTETSPNVHCTNKTECHVKNKLNASNLKGSFLNTQFLPTCPDKGTLKVSEGNSKKQNVTEVNCDGDSGHYYYITTDANFKSTVTKNTVFSCDYPPVDSRGKSQMEPETSIIVTGICAFIGAFFLAAVVHFILIVRDRRQMAAMNKQMETVDVENSDRYKVEKNQYQDEENKDDLFANDYLIKKREEAARDVLCETLPTEIPADNRDKSRLSPDLDANLGLRSGGKKKKFVKIHPAFSATMLRLNEYAKLARDEQKRTNQQKTQKKSKKSE